MKEVSRQSTAHLVIPEAAFTYTWDHADGKYFESVLSHEERRTLQ
jgi:hypothetical protein